MSTEILQERVQLYWLSSSLCWFDGEHRACDSGLFSFNPIDATLVCKYSAVSQKYLFFQNELTKLAAVSGSCSCRLTLMQLFYSSCLFVFLQAFFFVQCTREVRHCWQHSDFWLQVRLMGERKEKYISTPQ